MTGLIYETLKTKHQMRKKVPQVKEGREVLEKLQELNKEKGKDDTKLRNFAASLTDWTEQCNCNKAQDIWRQHSSEPSNDELLWMPRMKRLPRVVWPSSTNSSCGQRVNCADVPKSKVGKPDVWNPEGMGSQTAE